MILEDRYTVIKHTDREGALTSAEEAALYRMCTKVQAYRAKVGKPPLQGLFVKKDWPEYEPTLAAIASRVAAGS